MPLENCFPIRFQGSISRSSARTKQLFSQSQSMRLRESSTIEVLHMPDSTWSNGRAILMSRTPGNQNIISQEARQSVHTGEQSQFRKDLTWKGVMLGIANMSS